MTSLGLVLFLAAPSFARQPKPKPAPSKPTLAQSLAELDALVRDQDDKPADEIKALDKKIGALKTRFLSFGPATASPLSQVAADAAKPMKERVWAATFLAMLEDPGAYPPLSKLALDRAQPDAVRATALSGLAATGVDAASLRDTACGALAQEDLPSDSLREAALIASRVGCDDVEALSVRARAYGSRPKAEPGPLITAAAIDGLARSHPLDAARELLSLLDYYAPGTRERGHILGALREQLPNLKALRAEALTKACDALPSEATTPANAIAALELIDDLDARGCEKTVLRALGNDDAEVVAQAAEVLLNFRSEAAKKPLAKIIDGAIADPRFGPRPGRPDPAASLDRIRQAYNNLR